MSHRAARRWWLAGLILVCSASLAQTQDAAALYRTAEAAFADKAWDKALEAFRLFVVKYPDDQRAPRAMYRIGECHGAANRYESAAQAFQLCYKRYPDANVADSARFNEGFYFYRAQKWQQAAFAYQSYIKHGTNPGFKALAWYWRAEALYQLARPEDAAVAYQAFLALPAETLKSQAVAELVPYARFSIAACHYDAKEYVKAIAAVRVVLAKHAGVPVVADALWYGAQAFRQLKKLDDAVQWYQRLADEYKTSPYAPEALYAIFEIEQARGNKEAARKAMDRLGRDYPKTDGLAGNARFRVAAERLKAKDFATAQKLYREALTGATGEDEAAALLGLAEASFGLEQFDEAAGAYRKLLGKFSSDRNATHARLRLGEVLIRQGKFADAEKLYREALPALPAGPNAALARYNLALALLGQGKGAEAAPLFAEAAELDRAGEIGAGALLKLGGLYLEQKKPAEARTAWRDYLKRYGNKPEAAQALWGVGEASYRLEDWPAALEAYQSLVTKFADSALTERAYYRLVEVYRKLGQADKAEQVSEVLRRKYPTSKLSAAAQLSSGTEAFKARRYKVAVEAFEAFVKANPEHEEAPAALAYLAASLYLADDVPNHWQRAAEAYQQLAQKHPQVVPDCLFWAGSAYLEAGQPQPAVDALRGFLKAQPQSKLAARGQMLLGRALVAVDKPVEAAAVLQVAVEQAGNDLPLRTEARYELAWALLAAGKEEQGYAVFRQLVDDDPKGALTPDARFRLAGRAHQLKRYDDAVTAYRQWLSDYPEHALRPKVAYNLAFALEAKGEQAAASAAYAEAAKLLVNGDPELRQQAAYRTGLCLYRAGDHAGALKALDAFDAAHPDSKLRVEALHYRGQALAAQEKWADAAKVFRKLADDFKDHILAPSARFNLGVALQNQQKYDEARAVYGVLVQQAGLAPELVADAQVRLGEVLYAQKRHDEALEWFVRAEHGPVPAVRPAARYWAALCYQHKGETAKAREKLNQVINEAPQSEWGARAKKALDDITR